MTIKSIVPLARKLRGARLTYQESWSNRYLQWRHEPGIVNHESQLLLLIIFVSSISNLIYIIYMLIEYHRLWMIIIYLLRRYYSEFHQGVTLLT